MNIFSKFLILCVLVGHVASNSSYLINDLLGLDSALTELYLSEEGESEEESEELEEKDTEEFNDSYTYSLTLAGKDKNSLHNLRLKSLKDSILKETCTPPPKM